jgi:DNA-binding CsgD family transcriptional regulator
MKRLTNLLLFFILATASCLLHASFPTIRNFPREQTPGGSQTWDIGCDSLGRMLFANSYGLLEYDSNRWRLTPLPNGSAIRTFLFDRAANGSERIYVGGSEEFGYFELEEQTGERRYVSLTPLLPRNFPSYSEIWDINKIEGTNTIWFQANNEIFRYDGKTLIPIHVQDRITASGTLGTHFYIASLRTGVSELVDRHIQNYDLGDLPVTARVVELLPFHGNSLMIVTEYDGLFLLRGGRIQRLATDIDGFLMGNQVFCAAAKGDRYAFGTVSKGAVTKNFNTGRVTYANTATGLQNNTVLSLFYDDDNDLWLGLDNGIDMMMTGLPYTSLLGKKSAYGAGYSSLLQGNTLYLGTNQGLYVTGYPMGDTPEPPSLSPVVRGQVWDIREIGGTIFVCTDAGVKYGNGSVFTSVAGMPGSWSIVPLKGYDDYLLVSTYERLHLLQRQGSAWVNVGEVAGYNDIGGRLTVDERGNVWLPHWLKGIYMMRIDPTKRTLTTLKFYNKRDGFPTNHNIGVVMLNGRPLFSSEGGFFRFGSDGKMHVDENTDKLLGVEVAPRLHISPYDGSIWSVTNDLIKVAQFNADGSAKIDTVSYSPIARHLIAGFDHFNFMRDNRLLVSVQEGFFDVDLSLPARKPTSKKVFFSSVTAYGDSSYTYHPSDVNISDLEIPYSNNSLRFEVVAPEYRGGDQTVLYSYKLDEYDSDWSGFVANATKEYTHLHEGTYTMRVRSYNTFTKHTDEASFSFRVLPPWYRSWWAIIIYFCLTVGGLIFCYKLIRESEQRSSRRVAEMKERELEKMRSDAKQESLEKDYEIAELKSRQLEVDVKHKAEELSNITMNVARKNEILLDISTRIERLNTENASPETLKELSRIQSLIKKNISHDDDWRNFLHNFDTAYDDFARRLSEKHPGLTQTELRVCCYLKMGLSSKDIAPLFNISYRSVEMTRYRIRKKLGMDRDTNLTNYLQNFS